MRRQGKKYQKRIGDWEIYTVIGKRRSRALVTIVERKTLYTLIARVYGKCADWVTQSTIALLGARIE